MSSSATCTLAVKTQQTNGEEYIDIPLQNLRLSAWLAAASLRLGAGGNDNVTLRPNNRQPSSLWYSEGDAFIAYKGTNKWSVELSLYGEDVRYFTSDEADHETFGMVTLCQKYDLGDPGSIESTTDLIYQDQVLDASVTEEVLQSIVARGAEIGQGIAWTGDLCARTKANLALRGARDLFQRPLDDYWEMVPSAKLTFALSTSVAVSVDYRYVHRWYDTRHPVTRHGSIVTSRLLEYSRHDSYFALTAKPRGNCWQIELFFDYSRNIDNGDGYFNYDLLGGGIALRYERGQWRFNSRYHARYYVYDWQPVLGKWTTPRKKLLGSVSVTLERKISEHFWIFWDFRRETSDANQKIDSYTANRIVCGLHLEL